MNPYQRAARWDTIRRVVYVGGAFAVLVFLLVTLGRNGHNVAVIGIILALSAIVAAAGLLVFKKDH